MIYSVIYTIEFNDIEANSEQEAREIGETELLKMGVDWSSEVIEVLE